MLTCFDHGSHDKFGTLYSYSGSTVGFLSIFSTGREIFSLSSLFNQVLSAAFNCEAPLHESQDFLQKFFGQYYNHFLTLTFFFAFFEVFVT